MLPLLLDLQNVEASGSSVGRKRSSKTVRLDVGGSSTDEPQSSSIKKTRASDGSRDENQNPELEMPSDTRGSGSATQPTHIEEPDPNMDDTEATQTSNVKKQSIVDIIKPQREKTHTLQLMVRIHYLYRIQNSKFPINKHIVCSWFWTLYYTQGWLGKFDRNLKLATCFITWINILRHDIFLSADQTIRS